MKKNYEHGNIIHEQKKQKRFDKMTMQFIVNFAMLPLFLATAITGILKFPGFLKALGISVHRVPVLLEVLAFIHDWAGIGLTFLVCIHLVQHFSMTVNFVKRKMMKSR
jgi:hypothetical protein